MHRVFEGSARNLVLGALTAQRASAEDLEEIRRMFDRIREEGGNRGDQPILSQFWVQRLGWTLLHFLWQGTAIVVVYAMLRSLLGVLCPHKGATCWLVRRSWLWPSLRR